MEFQNVYFLGIGGIGMSALARYFLHEGKRVAGYDRTESELTGLLSAEGAAVTYDEAVAAIPEPFRDRASTLVVYTPAVPHDHPQWEWFRAQGFEIVKRSRMLGVVAQGKYVMAVAGTHGKTTTTTLTAWLNHEAGGAEALSSAVFRRISLPTWCWGRGRGWWSRPMSSTVRSCNCGPMRRW